jgi:TRAP-type C4-dicarboxylate transport system permease small subunit
MTKSDYQNSFFKDLFDYKLRKYITRRVASAVYLFYLILIPIVTLVLTYVTYKYAAEFYESGSFHWQLFAIWIVGPFLGLLALILTRLIIELNIAVVNIAENTESIDPKASLD